ncbi:MAG: hypothetical protein ABSH09_27080 [Bryobacteraceae bacterium]|jgi:hypothetical protein
MKYWLVLGVALISCLAQPAPPQRKNTVGEVQSADSASNQLKIKTDAGVIYTVTTDERTNFLKVGADLDLKKAAKIASTDIVTGDRVLSRGVVSEDTKTIAASSVVVMTKADVAQKQQKDREEWVKRGVAGTITAINPDTHEITLKTDAIPPKTVAVDVSGKVDYHRYAPGSVKFSDAQPSSFADLKVGDRLRALADKNEEGTRYKAEEIVSGSFRTLAAQIVSVDLTANTVMVKDLSSKDKQPVTIHVNQDTVMKRMPERMAMFMAMRLNGAAPGGVTPNAGQGAAMQGRPQGAPPASPAPSGPAGNFAQMGNGAGGSAGGPGGGGFGGGGRGDLQQMMERLPKLEIAELKPGDALIISSTNGADRSNLTAITIVAGVEPFLASAPRSAGAVNLGSWNFDIGMPAQ